MSYSRTASQMPAPQPVPRRIGVQLLLALFLLLAQTGLFLHELEHQSTAPDAYCTLCLAAQHLGNALHTTHAQISAPPPAIVPPQYAVPRVHAHPGVPFSARAPPRPVLV